MPEKRESDGTIMRNFSDKLILLAALDMVNAQIHKNTMLKKYLQNSLNAKGS
jgi:hypothetical protein